MTDATHPDDPSRGATAAIADALLAVDARLAEARHAGRAVRYMLDGDPTALTREEVEAWLVGAEAEGITHVRYRVAPGDAHTVHVSLGAVEPIGPS